MSQSLTGQTFGHSKVRGGRKGRSWQGLSGVAAIAAVILCGAVAGQLALPHSQPIAGEQAGPLSHYPQ